MVMFILMSIRINMVKIILMVILVSMRIRNTTNMIDPKS